MKALVSVICVFEMLCSSAFAEVCTLDRITFRDAKTKREFVAKREAVSFTYECGNKFISAQKERPDLKDCRGPFGIRVIAGVLEGKKIMAIFYTGDSSPCCGWESVMGDDVSTLKKIKSWRPRGQGTRIDMKSDWWAISSEPGSEVTGPLAGGNYVPVACAKVK